MKAQKLLSGASYGPDRLKEIFRAFDGAWAAIKPIVEDSALAHEAARLKLANVILSVAKDDAAARRAVGKKPRKPPAKIQDNTSA
jgi:hypothetical protein